MNREENNIYFISLLFFIRHSLIGTISNLNFRILNKNRPNSIFLPFPNYHHIFYFSILSKSFINLFSSSSSSLPNNPKIFKILEISLFLAFSLLLIAFKIISKSKQNCSTFFFNNCTII